MSSLRKKITEVQSLKRSDLIVLKHYGDRVKDLEAIRNKVRANLQSILFEIDSFQELQYQALKQISLISRTVQNEPASIEKAAQKVMSHFGFIKRKSIALIKPVEGNKTTQAGSSDDSPLELFNHFILGFSTAPKSELIKLKGTVEYHLRFLDDLVRMYEQEDVIKKYKNDEKVPSGNRSRILIDFYERCIAERDTVLDFFLNKLEEKAIWRASATLIPLHFLVNPFKDFPYRCWKIYADEYFDYRKISTVHHRIRGIDGLSEENASTLYSKSPTLFYKKLFKLKPEQQFFSNIDQYRKILPSQYDREPIFSELKKLFKKKEWIAFFALDLLHKSIKIDMKVSKN